MSGNGYVSWAAEEAEPEMVTILVNELLIKNGGSYHMA